MNGCWYEGCGAGGEVGIEVRWRGGAYGTQVMACIEHAEVAAAEAARTVLILNKLLPAEDLYEHELDFRAQVEEHLP